MLLEAIYHRPKLNWAYAYNESTLHIRVRTKRGDADCAEVFHGDKCLPWERMETSPMRVFASDEHFDYWEAEVKPPYGRLCYAFRIGSREGKEFWLTEDAIGEDPPERHLGLFEFPYLNHADLFHTPEWVKDAVFYQIFPERFENGNADNDPPGTYPWGGEPTYTNFFGGDLQGIMDRVGHLVSLGVTALYLTPIFEAPANHKYDTKDYRKVDPHFGTGETLKQLVRVCHAHGIRVVLDAVFNHSGVTFAPFRDIVEKGEHSPYASWFCVEEWPVQSSSGGIPTYRTFAFEPTMPKLNTANPEVRKYLLDTAVYWIREYGIDGWRLDVANEVDHKFWRAFRDAVKEANPEAYILGEIWHDSVMWLQGDQFDGVMNYPYSRAVLDFFVFGHLNPRAFADRIGGLLARYPKQANEACLNLLGSHDTVRLLTLCKGDRDRMLRAVVFLFTSVGVPCIYYGDEVGMDGEFDPFNRKCMEWNPGKQDQVLFRHYKELIRLRNGFPCLRTGGIRFHHADPITGLLVYERRLGQEAVLVAIHNGEEGAASFPVPPGSWRPWQSNGRQDEGIMCLNGGERLRLAPGGWTIWIGQEEILHETEQ